MLTFSVAFPSEKVSGGWCSLAVAVVPGEGGDICGATVQERKR